MKRILLSTLALVLIIGCLLTGASAAQNTKATLSSQAAHRGEEVTLTVTLSDTVKTGSGYISFSHGDGVEIVGGAWSVGNPLTQEFANSDGTFMFTFATDIEGKIFSVKVKVDDSAPFGEYRIDMVLKLYDSANTDIACTSVSGVITVSCDHEYTKQDTAEDYLKSEASCQSPAVYYYSCEHCGERGTKTFEYGEKAHNFTKEVISDEYKASDADCENKATYYYCCEACDEMGTETFTYGVALGHTGGTATCTEQAVCTRCEQPYGTFASHKYSTLVPAIFEKHTQTELVASVVAHYRCTVCEKYFTARREETTLEALTGEMPAHSYDEWQTDEDKHWKECSCGLREEENPHQYDDKSDITCNICEYNRTLPHAHGNGVKQDGQAASCTENGWKEYYMCTCGNCFTDADCKNPIPDLKAWKNGDGKLAAAHKYGALVPAIPEKHTQTELVAGIAEHYQCTVCGKYFTNTKVETTFDKLRGAVPAHSYGTWQSDADSHWQTCACGKKTEVVAHSGGEATCEAKAKCSACAAEYGDIGDHKYSAATCTAKAKCTVCGTETGELAAHNDADDDGKCDACDYQISVREPKKPIVRVETVIIIVGIAVVLGICILTLFRFVFRKRT